MANVKIIFDIRPLVQEFMRTDIKASFKNVAKDSALLEKIVEIERLWKQILNKISRLGEKIAKEGISSSMVAEAGDIANACCSLGKIAGPLLVEGGSFVPGPVGIVCSLALAIADFAVGNFIGGFFNLLGAIPFAKGASKAIKPMIEKIVKGIHNNKEIMLFVKQSSRAYKPSTNRFLRSTNEETKGLFENYVKDGHYINEAKKAEAQAAKMKTTGEMSTQTYRYGEEAATGQAINISKKLDSGYNAHTANEAQKEITNYGIMNWKYSINPKGGNMNI